MTEPHERQVFFNADRYRLEGRLQAAPGDRGVVITHPHPLYGGNLDNHVVAVLAEVYQRHSYSTLRFNFRGVGHSQGSYDDGQGEQQDVRAALDYLRDQGKTVLSLVGYSFGAWVNALLGATVEVEELLLVSPPVALLDFSPVVALPRLGLVITGSRDAFAPPATLAELVPQWQPQAGLEVINGADHFYSSHGPRLAALVANRLKAAGAGTT